MYEFDNTVLSCLFIVNLSKYWNKLWFLFEKYQRNKNSYNTATTKYKVRKNIRNCTETVISTKQLPNITFVHLCFTFVYPLCTIPYRRKLYTIFDTLHVRILKKKVTQNIMSKQKGSKQKCWINIQNTMKGWVKILNKTLENQQYYEEKLSHKRCHKKKFGRTWGEFWNLTLWTRKPLSLFSYSPEFPEKNYIF